MHKKTKTKHRTSTVCGGSVFGKTSLFDYLMKWVNLIDRMANCFTGEDCLFVYRVF